MKKNIIIIILLVAVVGLSFMCGVTLMELDKNKNGNLEVERKYLLDINNLPQEVFLASVQDFEQTYFNFSPEMRVRKIDDLYYFMTIKLPKDNIGLSREEIEVAITKEEYDGLIKKRVGNTIYKKRYELFKGKNKIEVDVYYGDLSGLCVAEVEFKNVKKANSFVPPDWFGLDITSDLRYKNANLAKDGMPD